jgi:hypothetical protein
VTRTTPPVSTDEPRMSVFAWMSAFARALIALPTFRRHMMLVEASLNRQMKTLEARIDELERQSVAGGTPRPGTITADGEDEANERLSSVSVSLRELGRRLSAIESGQTPLEQ